ncbi:CPBP family intramembrane glutamic endopeptidase [Terracidiphilus gabretensis]|uniref:CPBP family intramembrane glutamic endopeptidase n=1 Tax=Terracidiphilus gabretensis TaxID=1577687 RepID=UPI00071B4F72|nr:type II CAAX endopeptidase family protein [Terracidiphilus gabretensis]
MDSPPAQPSIPERHDSLRPAALRVELGSSTPSSIARRVFIGPFGLRAGWSLLIYFAIFAAILVSIFVVVRHSVAAAHPATAAARQTTGAPAPAGKRLADAPMLTRTFLEWAIFPILLLLSWIMAAVERRKLSAFGLGGVHPFRRFLIGAVWGVLAISLLIVVLYSLHLLSFDARLEHGPAILIWGAIQLFAFLGVGLSEEYLFRGYIQFTLTRGLVGLGNLISQPHARAISFWLASSGTSALFLLAHTSNNGENLFGLLQVFLVGFVFLAALWRTGSLWWAIGFHTSWDWTQSFLYGVPDSGSLMQGRLFATHASGNPVLSGGTAGPEGSVFCIPVLLLVLVVLFFTHSSPQPPLETKT